MSDRYTIEIQKLGTEEFVPVWSTSGEGAAVRAASMQTLFPVDIREYTQVVRISEEREVIS